MKITERQLRRIIRETFNMAGVVNRTFPPGDSSSTYSGSSSGGIVLGLSNPRLGTSAVEADDMEEEEEVIDEDEDETAEEK